MVEVVGKLESANTEGDDVDAEDFGRSVVRAAATATAAAAAAAAAAVGLVTEPTVAVVGGVGELLLLLLLFRPSLDGIVLPLAKAAAAAKAWFMAMRALALPGCKWAGKGSLGVRQSGQL